MKRSKNYTVYFEIYGKKMKAKIVAATMADAQQKVKDKITFHKTVVEEDDLLNGILDVLNV